MQPRRRFLMTALTAAPAVLRARTYTWIEIEKMISRGDVKGKLTKDDLPTPALLVNLDGLESNIRRMATYLKEHQRALRPHGKTHKCPEIARRCIQAGAVGACAAKVSEAEAFARGGIGGLLITTAVVGRHKIERAIRLASQKPDTMFVVDNAQNASDLNDAARAAKIRLNLAIDLRVGGRTGIAAGAPAVALAEQLQQLSNVRFAGLQAYAGQASHAVGFERRRQVSLDAMAPAVETKRMLVQKGIQVPLLTGGSTGTYNIDPGIEGIDEHQPGSFLFMDIDYNRIGGADGDAVFDDFANSLTVIASVVSKPEDSVAIVDAGFKAFSTDRPFMPAPKDKIPMTYSWGGDEHGRLKLEPGAYPFKVGDKIEFIIPHCDPTVNLYDRIFACRGDNVEAVWPVTARGMSQ
jgi:D-serine deaminase-like pyridoxal phosphate-dependent protein